MTEVPSDQAEQLALLIEQAREDLRTGRTLVPPSEVINPEVAAAYRQLLQSLLHQQGAEDPPSNAGEQRSPESTVPDGLPHLGRYLLLGPAGSGGMATVYKALDPALKRFVAVKVPRFSGSPFSLEQQKRRFLREARAVSQIHHPNVCPVHDLGEERDTPYLVMEWIEGDSLQRRLQLGRFEDQRTAVALVCQVLRGLEALHVTCGLVHRDLKPANILLDGSGTPLLSDFGLVRPLQDAEYLTAPGTLLGTVPYMAPEQVGGSPEEAIGPATDLYSMGVVLYQMLTGRLPFEMPFPNILWHIQQGPVPSLRSHRPDLDPALVELVHKAMAREPAERFASAARMRAALENWLQQGTGAADSVTVRQEALPSAPPRRRRLASAAVLLSLAGLLAGGLALVLHSKGPPTEGSEQQPAAFLTEGDVLTAIRDDLRGRPAEERKFRRYFSLANLANDRGRVSPAQLRLTRAAVAKLLNSLSWKKALAPVEPLGPQQAVLAVDLRALGWEESDAWGEPILWQEILKLYPYGRRYVGDVGPGPLAREVRELSGQDLAHLRADWFVAAASEPPLYPLLLRLPAGQRELEKKLGIEYSAAFRDNRLARAAVLRSGVSPNNRAFDRTATAYGAYWLSYEAKNSEQRRDSLRYPLGPRLADHPFPQETFTHDGSTALFSLPNGLQGYAVFDADGRRLAAADRGLLRDPHGTAGSPKVVAGVSCMGCHKGGTVPFRDDLRSRSRVTGAARRKLERLAPGREALDRLFADDDNRFLAALRSTVGVFLLQGEEDARDLRAFPEPIAAVAQAYRADLSLEQAALELGVRDPSLLRQRILDRKQLREAGLVPLAEGRPLPRRVWANLTDRVFSPFQDCAQALEHGQPHRVR